MEEKSSDKALKQEEVYGNRRFRDPLRVKRTMGTVSVTSVQMFGKVSGGSSWGIPVEFHPRTVALGAIARKPTVVGDRVEAREFLRMMIVFDHDVVDGAPVAIFLQRLRQLMESGFGTRGRRLARRLITFLRKVVAIFDRIRSRSLP